MIKIYGFVLMLSIFIGLGFCLGCLVGDYNANINNVDLLCKQIKTETSEYFACKQKDFLEVIKEIK